MPVTKTVYQYQFKEGEITNSFSITHIKMWNVLVAIRMWGHMWDNKSVVIKCENQAVVSVVNINVTKDHILATMCRNIWLETSMNDIILKVIHIPGKDNVCADLLSRWHFVYNNMQKLTQYIKCPQWCIVKAKYLCLNLEI